MTSPKIYRVAISDLEYVYRMSATPLKIEGSTAYLICHAQSPNSKQKKIAIEFTDKDGVGFDVYDYDKIVEYTNIQGQYPTSIGPALIKNIENIYPDVNEMIAFTEKFHKQENADKNDSILS